MQPAAVARAMAEGVELGDRYSFDVAATNADEIGPALDAGFFYLWK